VTEHYDLVAVGSGPAGRAAAIEAARLGARVALVERGALGGASVNGGVLAGAAARQVALALLGQGLSRRAITLEDLRLRALPVVERERAAHGDRLRDAGVTLIPGAARLLDGRTLGVAGPARPRRLRGGHLVIAVGSRAEGAGCDGRRAAAAGAFLGLPRVPRSVVVVGAGPAGMAPASLLAALGSRVTVVDRRLEILAGVDRDVAGALRRSLDGLGAAFRLGAPVAGVEVLRDGAAVRLRGGPTIRAEAVLWAAGRRGAAGSLRLEAAGLAPDAGGRIPVDADGRTRAPRILAAGSVAAGAATPSAQQGRVAARSALGAPGPSPEPAPVGIDTIPEIGAVGRTEADLVAARIPHAVGVARHRDLARGHILGEAHGLLKLLVSPGDGRLLGVHVLGHGAMELVHVGHAVMALGGTLDWLLDAPFVHPTLAEAFGLAAVDAAHRLRAPTRIAS
jgi:NAD(P) transhydrogenase